ncbi:MAG TPA: M1 family aminopeptidase, partial [Nocardioidaceae bacterium]|nr:M1 family aminopeptidase [Nocardioidaceae bacterium]
YGNSLTLRRWRHIWLNEGFATYAEWLWLERQGIRTARQTFRDTVDSFPAHDPFWRLDLVDPGRDALFDLAVYYRGAMVLQALRNRVGDETFFQILRRWARTRSGETVTTGDLIALAERVSGEDLDRVFRRWLFAQRKPRTTWSPRVTAGTDRTSGPVAAFSPHHLPPRR